MHVYACIHVHVVDSTKAQMACFQLVNNTVCPKYMYMYTQAIVPESVYPFVSGDGQTYPCRKDV